MERHFGRGFGDVRVHTEGRAGDAARAVDALAFTVGSDVVFRAGQYAPDSEQGRRLLAHELAHVVQQDRPPAAPSAEGGITIGPPGDAAEREADEAAAALGTARRAPAPRASTSSQPATLRRRSIFAGIAGLFMGDDFPVEELQAYLRRLGETGRIEDYTESDNKARAVTNAWAKGGSPFVLDARIKTLLIKEMQSGFTGDDDEQAILELLERSDAAELGQIFGAGGVSAEDLNSDVHGEEWDRLRDFYRRRFEGGMQNVLAGTVTPRGSAVPLGAALPTGGPPQAAAATQEAQPGDRPCSVEDRQSMDRIVLCCTGPMLREIDALRTAATRAVHKAALRLSSSPDDVSGALWDHFRVRPADRPRVNIILNQFDHMLSALTGSGVQFRCFDIGDPTCRGSTAFTVPTCTGGGTFHVTFCSNYAAAAETGGSYLVGPDWVRTMVHEFAHVGCPGLGLIAPAGQESYRGRGRRPYPPDNADAAIRNADGYANFAMDMG